MKSDIDEIGLEIPMGLEELSLRRILRDGHYFIIEYCDLFLEVKDEIVMGLKELNL